MNKNQIIARNLKAARIAAGLTQHDVAKKYPPHGCSDAYITQIESGEVNISIKVLEKLASIVGKTVSQLTSDELEPSEVAPPARPLSSILKEAIKAQERLEVKEVPVYGKVAAGTLKVSEQKLEGYVPIPITLLPKVNKEFYALTIEGESLSGDGIHDGDTVIIEPNADFIDGKIFICKVDHEQVVGLRYSQRLLIPLDKGLNHKGEKL